MLRFLISAFFLTFIPLSFSRADVGVILYESRGTDARGIQSGHVALIATRLCPDGLAKVRRCKFGETPGVVISKYAGAIWGSEQSVLIVPIMEHFFATKDWEDRPLLSSEAVLIDMQKEYWRKYLQKDIPPMSQAQYEEYKEELKEFNLGRILKKAARFEYLAELLVKSPLREPTEPIAIREPQTGQLIPNGGWRQAVGAQHVRDSVIFVGETTDEEEERLIAFVNRSGREPFNIFTANCTNLAKRGLKEVFGRSIGFRAVLRDLSNVGAAVPLSIATDFLKYLKKSQKAYQVAYLPMQPGTRTPSLTNKSVANGAIFPDASQGKIAFGAKLGLGLMNPSIWLIVKIVDKVSGYMNVDKEVVRASTELKAELATSENWVTATTDTAPDLQKVLNFGTQNCWKQKRHELIAAVGATEERRLGQEDSAFKSILKSGRPYQMPKDFEKAGFFSSRLTRTALKRISLIAFQQDVSIPNHVMTSDELKTLDFYINSIVAVINWDLTISDVDRRSTETFDQDWKTLLQLLKLRGAKDIPPPISVRECSQKEFDSTNGRVTDARTKSAKILPKIGRYFKAIVTGPIK